MPTSVATTAIVHFSALDNPFLANGSLIFTIGNCAWSVSVLPNNTLTMASALMAQPLALSSGARLRLRSFIQAKIMDGPLTTINIAGTMSNAHACISLTSDSKLVKKVPIEPIAKPTAAKIPANLATSNGAG
mgnify:CR=1 FL=1